MALLKAIPIIVLVFSSAILIQAASTKGRSINQEIKQQVNKFNGGGSINQNVEQVVDIDSKNAKKSKNPSSDELKSINQNVGQVIENFGGKNVNSNINQKVHQHVSDGDATIDKVTSQAIKDSSDEGKKSSEEEIIFRRHHSKASKKSDEESIESSEEIKIHRGKHSSEISHKKHEDRNGDMSEESDEKVIIKKEKEAKEPKKKKIEVDIKEKEDSEEAYPKRTIYRPAKKVAIKPAKIFNEDLYEYIRPGSEAKSVSNESPSLEEDLKESIESEELPSEEKKIQTKPKPCGCGKTTCNCGKKDHSKPVSKVPRYVKTVDTFKTTPLETPKYVEDSPEVEHYASFSTKSNPKYLEASPEVSAEFVSKKLHPKKYSFVEYSNEYPDSMEIYKNIYSEEDMPKKYYSEESYEKSYEPISFEEHGKSSEEIVKKKFDYENYFY